MTRALHPNTLQQLMAAGWHEGRNVDTDPMVAPLLHDGLPTNSHAHAFLAEFGGLKLTLARGVVERAEFEPRAALRWFEPQEVTGFSGMLKDPVCPVGYGSDHGFFIAGSGRVLFLNREWLHFSTFRDAADALDAICVPRNAYDVADINDASLPTELRESLISPPILTRRDSERGADGGHSD